MRTAPVALSYLGSQDRDRDEPLITAAMAVSALTHGDELAGEACALWSLAIRAAILSGEVPNLAEIAARLPGGAGAKWQQIVLDAERNDPNSFTPNGFVVTALQAAWSAIHQHIGDFSPESAGDHGNADIFAAVMATAIGIGNDTDTVASIAGALLGAILGSSAIPSEWQNILHGYPNATGADLAAFANHRARHITAMHQRSLLSPQPPVVEGTPARGNANGQPRDVSTAQRRPAEIPIRERNTAPRQNSSQGSFHFNRAADFINKLGYADKTGLLDEVEFNKEEIRKFLNSKYVSVTPFYRNDSAYSHAEINVEGVPFLLNGAKFFIDTRHGNMFQIETNRCAILDPQLIQVMNEYIADNMLNT